MASCRNCGKETEESAKTCPCCGADTVSPLAKKTQADEVSVGLCVIAFCFPLIGWIYWACVHANTPKRGRACGITAFVGFVVGVIFTMVRFALWGGVSGC